MVFLGGSVGFIDVVWHKKGYCGFLVVEFRKHLAAKIGMSGLVVEVRGFVWIIR